MNQLKLTVGAVCAMLTFGSTALAQTPVPVRHPGIGGAYRQRERHPEIRAAIRALERSRADLNRANTDFHGHREAALKYIDQALNELQQALASDRH